MGFPAYIARSGKGRGTGASSGVAGDCPRNHTKRICRANYAPSKKEITNADAYAARAPRTQTGDAEPLPSLRKGQAAACGVRRMRLRQRQGGHADG